MATIPEALTTLALAKRALGETTTNNDTVIEGLIDAATEWVQRQCNRKFGRRNYNREQDAAGVIHTVTGITSEQYFRFSGEGKSRVRVLPQYPVDRGGTFVLEELQTRATDGTETWTSSGYVKNYDYVVDWDKGIIRLLNGVFARGTLNYRVTFEAGFEEPSDPGTPVAPWVPADLTRCCNEMVKVMFDGGGGRVSQESIGTWSRSFNLDKENVLIDCVLAKYRSDSSTF